jgi:indolepyruvate ferredoxin oxidoreductase
VRLAEHLFGNAQAMNTMLLGLAWQRGLIPVSEAAILRAIELNGAAVSLNRRAFLWGRILAERPALEDDILVHTLETPPAALDALIEARAAALVAYQNTGLANRYRVLVNEVVARETQVFGEAGRLSRAAAEGLYRVIAYKDEYEVARLHAAASYGEKPRFHLSPPLIAGIDPATGRRRKIALPGWLALPLFRVLRHGKHLRGTALDLFGRQHERRMERALIDQYIGDLRTALAALRPDTLDVAVAIAQLPDMIRGFGPVKDANRIKAEEQRRVLLPRLAAAPLPVAAE